MPDVGFGLAPFGGSIWGFGTPSVANSSSAKVLKKLDGTQGAVPLMTSARDFTLDATGQKVGADATGEMVKIALYTQRNKSAVKDFGLDLSTLSVFSTDSQRKCDVAVRLALKHLTDRRAISVQSVRLVRLSTNGVQLTIKWVDLSNGLIDVATLPLGT
jgi:hypothetical protein